MFANRLAMFNFHWKNKLLSVMFISYSLCSWQWGGFYETHPWFLHITTLHGSGPSYFWRGL